MAQRFEERPERSEKTSNENNCKKILSGRGMLCNKIKEYVKWQSKASMTAVEEAGRREIRERIREELRVWIL